MFVCQDLQQNPSYGNFLMQNGSMSMYCISKKPCAWLSTKRGINAAASHIGQQKTIKPASGRQCIARETQCLSWSFLMIGIKSIFLKLVGIPNIPWVCIFRTYLEAFMFI